MGKAAERLAIASRPVVSTGDCRQEHALGCGLLDSASGCVRADALGGGALIKRGHRPSFDEMRQGIAEMRILVGTLRAGRSGGSERPI